MSDAKVLALIDKVIDKMVRVTVSDGREYLGRLQCVDQTKAVFVQDALELVDRESEHYLEHQLLTPELLKRCPDN